MIALMFWERVAGSSWRKACTDLPRIALVVAQDSRSGTRPVRRVWQD